MERVAFLIEQTGERYSCLLNPEMLVLKRTAGVRPRRSIGGRLIGTGMRDDPLLYSGGGTTVLELNLLFDVSLAGSSITTDDVRDLTRPLWQLSENAREGVAKVRLPLVHFVWGKAWNIPGVVTAVAERLEYFTPGGTPHRSWMRLRLVRADEVESPPTVQPPPPADWMLPDGSEPLPDDPLAPTVVVGVPDEDSGQASGQRLDEIAYRWFGNAAYWRLLASYNGLDDPMELKSGDLLKVPSATRSERSP